MEDISYKPFSIESVLEREGISLGEKEMQLDREASSSYNHAPRNYE